MIKLEERFNRFYSLLEAEVLQESKNLYESRKHYSDEAVQILKKSSSFEDMTDEQLTKYVHAIYQGGVTEQGEEYSPAIPAFTHAAKWIEAYIPHIAD